MQDMRKRSLERIKGQHQLTGAFNMKNSRSTVNRGWSPAPRWNACPSAMADVQWDKQALELFCLGGKDLIVPRQSLQWVSSAVGSFCIQLKAKTAKGGLLCALWSFPFPQTVGSLKCPSDFPRNYLVSPGRESVPRRTQEHRAKVMAWATYCGKCTGFWVTSASERAEFFQEEVSVWCEEGAASQQGLDVELSMIANLGIPEGE